MVNSVLLYISLSFPLSLSLCCCLWDGGRGKERRGEDKKKKQKIFILHSCAAFSSSYIIKNFSLWSLINSCEKIIYIKKLYWWSYIWSKYWSKLCAMLTEKWLPLSAKCIFQVNNVLVGQYDPRPGPGFILEPKWRLVRACFLFTSLYPRLK